MTTITQTHKRPGGILAGLKQRMTQYHVYRTTLNELSNLSDRELFDLGISRMDVRSIAYKAAYGG